MTYMYSVHHAGAEGVKHMAFFTNWQTRGWSNSFRLKHLALFVSWCIAIWPAPVQFWERSVWETKNSNVHLKKFNYTLDLTFQPFKSSKDSSPSRCEVYFHCSVKRACVKVTCVLFTKCYFVANPANWLNIVTARTVFENESKDKMHFKWSCWQNFTYWDKKKHASSSLETS